MSKNYVKVKRYYDNRLWSVAMVNAAVGKWITAEEYEMITKEVYHCCSPRKIRKTQKCGITRN